MDWSNERYVRAYTRDTADFLMLSWQARALFWEVLRKADRSGVIATRKGPRGLAAMVRWPVAEVTAALVELEEDGCLRAIGNDRGYVIPNYLPAQESVQSEKFRQQESRDRRAYFAVTNRDETSRAVTDGHAPSRAVTTGHEVSLLAEPSYPILPSLAEPEERRESPESPPAEACFPALAAFKAKVDAVVAKPGRKAKAKPGEPTELELAAARGVLEKLSKESGHGYRGAEPHLRLIVARLRDGVSEQDLRKVVVYCAVELKWAGDDKMGQFLRPETLFGPKNIARYLDPAVSWWAKGEEPAPKETPVSWSAGGAVDMSGKEPLWWGNADAGAVA